MNPNKTKWYSSQEDASSGEVIRSGVMTTAESTALAAAVNQADPAIRATVSSIKQVIIGDAAAFRTAFPDAEVSVSKNNPFTNIVSKAAPVNEPVQAASTSPLQAALENFNVERVVRHQHDRNPPYKLTIKPIMAGEKVRLVKEAVALMVHTDRSALPEMGIIDVPYPDPALRVLLDERIQQAGKAK